MNRDQAEQVARHLDPSEGEVIFFQSDGQILHPHAHNRSDLSPFHMDAYACTKEWGQIKVAKIHSDDYERGVEPDFSAFWF